MKAGTLQGRTVFLTGASSGIGRATAERLAAAGCRVWATARDTCRLDGLPLAGALEMDFERPETIDAAWQTAVRESGGVDVLVQNAGAGVFGALEETGDELARVQWEVLVSGPLRLLRHAAGHMRSRGRGRIIGVGSIAGELPMPFFVHYSAGKAAFAALLAGLWMELRPFGVRVTDLRPGDIRTPFNDAVRRAGAAPSPYGAAMARVWEEACRLLDAAPGPDRVAREIEALLGDPDPPPLRRCGGWFQVAGAVVAAGLPRGLVLRLIRAYYRMDRSG